MRYLYSLILLLLQPFILLRLYLRGKKLPAYRQRWLERFGIFPNPEISAGGIWVHAVSVGEVVAAIPLITELLNNDPGVPIIVTTTTPTGSARVKQAFGEKVTHVYLPYDLPVYINNFIYRLAPKTLIIMETELWPNLLYTCKHKQLKICLVNARLSDNSFANYKKIKFLLRGMLQQIDMIAAQTTVDAQRFIDLGAHENAVTVVGNLKYDVPLTNIKRQIVDRLVWIAASTHDGEEVLILQLFKKLKQDLPSLLLILVPRHPDRFKQIADLLTTHKLSYVRRSANQFPKPDTDVWFGDTMGELNFFYAQADMAFVGGSLVPIGGHNLLEPVASGVATVTGPYMHNFRDITAKLVAANAVTVIHSEEELADKLLAWGSDKVMRLSFATRGKQVLRDNQGALNKVLALV